MKLFQRLLLTPAALGLIAPMAAQAAEVNLAGVAQYDSAPSVEQVTSINQFSDVRPTDWAFQALSNLIERYGCVAGYPDGTYRGAKPMTRYEAAALLNACLDRVTEVTDELKRLMKEFEKELAVLRGRVDGLEAKVGELEASQFSTTTRLRADTRWVLGALNYDGNQDVNGTYAVPPRRPATSVNLREALTFNYDVRLNFDTSFSGKDLLRTQLRAGNFRDSGFSSSNSVTPLANLDAAFEENCGTGADCGDVVAINRLFYRFPIGSGFTAVLGGRMRQDDGLAVKPSVYTADKILKYWDFNGAPGAYSQLLGAGAGLWWKQPGKTGFSLGGVYISGNGDAGAPSNTGCTNYVGDCGGIGNSASQQTGTLQLAYTGKNWNLTGAYTYNSSGVNIPGTPLSQALLPGVYGSSANGSGRVNSWSVAGYWQPLENGWFPSISAGWGYNDYEYGGTVNSARNSAALLLDSAASQSWYVGLNWRDLFAKGNALGFAVGQPTFITSLTGAKGNDIDTFDGNYAFEVYYKFQVTDNIAITPSLFWLSRPRGALTEGASSAINAINNPSISSGEGLGTLGGLIQTTFKF